MVPDILSKFYKQMESAYIPERQKAALDFMESGGSAKIILEQIQNETYPNEHIVSMFFFISGKESDQATLTAWEYLMARFQLTPNEFISDKFNPHVLNPPNNYLLFSARKYLIIPERLEVYINHICIVKEVLDNKTYSENAYIKNYFSWQTSFFLSSAIACSIKCDKYSIFSSQSWIEELAQNIRIKPNNLTKLNEEGKIKALCSAISNVKENISSYCSAKISRYLYESNEIKYYWCDFVSYISSDSRALNKRLELLEWFEYANRIILSGSKTDMTSIINDVLYFYFETDLLDPYEYSCNFCNLLLHGLKVTLCQVEDYLCNYIAIENFLDLNSAREAQAYMALDVLIGLGSLRGYYVLKELYFNYRLSIHPYCSNYFSFLLDKFFHSSKACFSPDIGNAFTIGFSWESLCQEICLRLYSSVITNCNSSIILPNNAVPDIAWGDEIKFLDNKMVYAPTIAECKKSLYFAKFFIKDTLKTFYDPLNNRTTLKYYDYCDELQYWILEKPDNFEYPNSSKIKIIFADDLLQQEYILASEKDKIRSLIENKDKVHTATSLYLPSKDDESLIKIIDFVLETSWFKRRCSQTNGSKVYVIRQYTLDGVFVCEYTDKNSAAEHTGISSDSITRNLRNERPSAGGFIWRKCKYGTHIDSIEPLKKQTLSLKNKDLLQINPKTGEVQNMFSCIQEASIKTGINQKSIRDAINGKQKHAGGFLWQCVDKKTEI